MIGDVPRAGARSASAPSQHPGDTRVRVPPRGRAGRPPGVGQHARSQTRETDVGSTGRDRRSGRYRSPGRGMR